MTDFSADSSQLLILFGGIKLGLGMPPFEFLRLTEDVPVKKLFVRDARQAWYLRGLPSVGSTVPEIVEWLRLQVRQQGVTRVITAGNSMGGYAALLFGALLGAERALAFSPQTFVSPRLLWRHSDRRWKWNRLRALMAGQGPFTDVFPVLAGHPATACDLYYCSGHRLDTAHACHLDGLPNVRLHPIADGGHQIIKSMRDTGELKKILNRALGA